MTANDKATVIEYGVNILAGVCVTLLGFQVIGKLPNGQPRYNAVVLRLFRWAGPAMIVVGLCLVIAHFLLGQ